MEKKDTSLKIFKLGRRDFIKIGTLGAGGLILGIPFACNNQEKYLTGNPGTEFNPNVYLQLKGDGELIIIAHRSEMGTGIRTSLPLVLADELDADWNKVKLNQATGDKKYGNQNTDGSFSIRMFYPQFRKAAALVKKMLLQAAANEWKINISECRAENHKIINSKGDVFGYGYLAEKAALLDLPDESEVVLKSKEEFKYITKKTSIYDLKDIVTGKAQYGYDIDIPTAKIAVISRNPEAGAGIISYNADKAMKVSGVTKVFKMKASGFPTGFDKAIGGVVIVAENTWAALKAKELLEIEWGEGINSNYDTDEFLAKIKKLSHKEGDKRRVQGDVKSAFNSAKDVIEQDFIVPHYSHSPMETPCAVASYKSDENCEIWAPVQSPQWVRGAVARAVGLEEEKVTINVTLIGSAFGRKSKPDFVVEAALISKEIEAPVKLLWTKEDDIQHDFYHFNCAQHMKVGIDENDKVNAWLHRSLFPPIGGTASAENNMGSNGELCQGVLDMPYNIENVSCETNKAPGQIRIGWLRSVGNINHAFAIGSMLDLIAEKREMDPIDNILDLLGPDRNIDFDAIVENFRNYNEKLEDFPCNTKRFRKVIELVREKSGWEKSLGKGRGMGFAAHRSFLTYVACVVEVEVDEENNIKIPMVHYVVDCGVPVNPERIKAQFEGGAVFGISLALKSEITVKNGAVQQSNLHDYEVARILDAPLDTKVHIVDSDEKPTGVGEPPVPPMIPALCNAIYMATGKRVTKLPFRMAQSNKSA